MSKTTLLTFYIFLISMNATAWNQVTIYSDKGEALACYIPQNQNEAAQLPCINRPIILIESFENISTYIFASLMTLDKPVNLPGFYYLPLFPNSGSHTNACGIYVPYRLQPLAQNNTWYMTQQSRAKKEESKPKLENCSMQSRPRYCKKYAFQSCTNSNCHYDHIPLDELKNRVVCFKQLKDSKCDRTNCLLRHLTSRELQLAKQQQVEGCEANIIVCPETDQEHDKTNCKYLHLQSTIPIN